MSSSTDTAKTANIETNIATSSAETKTKTEPMIQPKFMSRLAQLPPDERDLIAKYLYIIVDAPSGKRFVCPIPGAPLVPPERKKRRPRRSKAFNLGPRVPGADTFPPPPPSSACATPDNAGIEPVTDQADCHFVTREIYMSFFYLAQKMICKRKESALFDDPNFILTAESVNNRQASWDTSYLYFTDDDMSSLLKMCYKLGGEEETPMKKDENFVDFLLAIHGHRPRDGDRYNDKPSI